MFVLIFVVGLVSAEPEAEPRRITKRDGILFPQPLVLGPYQALPQIYVRGSIRVASDVSQTDVQPIGLPYDATAGNEYAGNWNSIEPKDINSAGALSGDCNDQYHGYHTLQGVYQTIESTQNGFDYPDSYLPPARPQWQPGVITKEVRVPVPQPYPVPVEKRIPVPVPQPYPVRVVKPVPYRVEVKVPVAVEKPYPVKVTQKVPVQVPVYVKVPQPFRVEVPVPRPYPVEKRVPVPVPVRVPVYIRVPATHDHHFHGDDCNHKEGGIPATVYGPPGYQPGTPITGQ